MPLKKPFKTPRARSLPLASSQPDEVVLRFPLLPADQKNLINLAQLTGLSPGELAVRLLEPDPLDSLRSIVVACAAVLADRREQLAKDKVADELAWPAAAGEGQGA
jgi:hypothetical protein